MVLMRENVYGLLRKEILSCRLAPGEEMREHELAERYEMSRSPVREALLRLEQERLVQVLPRQGYRVTPVSLADARELFKFRAILEPNCALEAAKSATDLTLSALEGFMDPQSADSDFVDYNRNFHSALAEASGNKRLALATCEVIEQSDRLVRLSISMIKDRDTMPLLNEHEEIIRLVQARDGRRAAKALRAHIERAERRTITALQRHAIVN